VTICGFVSWICECFGCSFACVEFESLVIIIMDLVSNSLFLGVRAGFFVV
jgi:hypothetical protein